MVYNVRLHHFDDPLIKQYGNFPPSKTPETVEQQRDILLRWNSEKEKMHERVRWDKAVLDEWKLRQLSKLVDHAFQRVPFYYELYQQVGFHIGGIQSWKDFESLPVVSKADLANNFPSRIVAKGCEPTKLHGIRTSGSNGVPITIVLDWNRVVQDHIDRMRMFEIMMDSPINESDWKYYIDYSLSWISSLEEKYRSFTISLDCPIANIVNHIRKLKPVVVCGVGHMIMEVANHLKDAQQLGIKCFSTNSETTSLEQRKKLSCELGVPVLDEYSSEELGLIATECHAGKYHVIEDSCHVELLSSDGCTVKDSEMGRVIGTDMWNMAMPIIRYDQGDLAEWDLSSEACSCGQVFRRLKHLHGRADQALVSPACGLIPAVKVLAIFDRTLACSDSGVRYFRLVQKTINTIEVYLVLNNNYKFLSSKIFELFKADIYSLFQYKMNIKPILMDELPQGNSYKRKTIINEFSKK